LTDFEIGDLLRKVLVDLSANKIHLRDIRLILPEFAVLKKMATENAY
jgi:hypothetical protein